MACISIISTFHTFNKLGSSITFSAQGGRARKRISPPKKYPPERNKTEARSAALLVQSRTQQKSFLFEEKVRRAQNQKSKGNFSAGHASVSSRRRSSQFRQS